MRPGALWRWGMDLPLDNSTVPLLIRRMNATDSTFLLSTRTIQAKKRCMSKSSGSKVTIGLINEAQPYEIESKMADRQ